MYVCMYLCMYVCNVCNVCNVCMIYVYKLMISGDDHIFLTLPGTFDGILFDAYPLSPGEAAGDGEVGAFFVEAARLLRPGGRFGT